MHSRQLLNIMMLLFALGLVASVLLTKKYEQTIQQLTTLDISNVQNIVIQHKQRELQFTKTKSGWTMNQPIFITANDFRIGTLLKLLHTQSHASYAADSLQLSDYGLINTETSIQFDGHEVIFGISNPVNDLRYVLFEQQVHLIDDLYYPFLSSQPGTLISHRLLPEDIVITQLKLPDDKLWLDNNQWHSNTDISSDRIVSTLQNWKNAQAFAVHNYNERESLGHINVRTNQTESGIDFFITDSDPWLILARPDLDIEYHLNIEMYNSLLKPGVENPGRDDANKEVIEVQSDDFLNVINH